MSITKTGMAFLAASFLISSGSQAATILGATAGASYWPSSINGQIQSGGSAIDLENDLNFERQDVAVLFATLEHPIPLVPNFRVQYSSLAQNTQGNITTSFQNVTFSGPVSTNVDLTHFDFTLYYEILDNWVSLDVGLNAKYFQGNIDIKQNSNLAQQTNTELKTAVPMLYASAAFDMPFTGLSLIAEGSGVSYSSNQLYDANIRLREQIAVFAFEVGYRTLKLKLNDVDGINVDADISGPFVSVMLKL